MANSHLSVASHHPLGFLSLELNLAARAKDPFLNFLSATLNISLHGDFAQSEGGRTLQSAIKWTPRYVSGQRTKLTDLSPKILHKIFTQLDVCTSTCLGLTSWSLYAIFRSHCPGKISLWEACYEPTYRTTSTLGDLLEPWFGARYRRRIWTLYSLAAPYNTYHTMLREHAYPIPQFLLKEKYGDREGELDERLALRWVDHGLSQRVCHKTGDVTYTLPSPFGKGELWYFQAFEAIKLDAHPAGNWSSWMEFWTEFDVFSRLGYMEKLRILEWFEDTESRQGLEEKWCAMFWFVLKYVLLVGWLTRWLRWGVMRTFATDDRMPWPAPKVGQREVRRDEKGDGMV